MRQLVLLRGCAGCGKSTWLKQHDLTQFTLSADDIRLLFQSPEMNIEGNLIISQKNDNEVWKFLFTLLERRMMRGEFTIIDATHSRSALINQYKNLCDKYRYHCTVVDFSDIPLDEVLRRNELRPIYKQVPEDAIRNMYERMKLQPASNWVKTIKPEDFGKTFNDIPLFNFNKYKRIHIFGDIHGCLDPISEYFQKYLWTPDDFYIFLGDYVDRGIQNKEVLSYLMPMIYSGNTLYLEGNHERWLRMWAEDEVGLIKSKEFLNYTMKELEGLDKKLVREFCRKLGQYAYFEYDDKYIFCNHGGVPNLPNQFTAFEELIKGVGKYEDVMKVEESWNTNHHKLLQFHGHRNIDNNPIQNGNCFNLCDTVEFGGNLRVAQLTKGKPIKFILIKNNTYFINTNKVTLPVVEDSDDILISLRSNKFIQEKKLGNNVSSFNFTREAFYEKEWNKQTMRARGLFVNTSTKEVVARSYEKFFEVGENDANKLPELKYKLVFPVNVYRKENGFLGIVGYNSENDELFISSKSTDKGPFKEWFKEILSSNCNLDNLKDFCKDNKVSLVFEVIDPINDPHIIEYDKSTIVLLDVIDREFEFSHWMYIDVCRVASELKLPNVKSMVSELKDYNALFEFINNFNNISKEDGNIGIEGYVLEDSNGYMFKLKTKSYKFWKWMRGVKTSLQAGHNVNTAMFTTPFQNQVYSFLKSKSREELTNKNIIQLRKEFYVQ